MRDNRSKRAPRASQIASSGKHKLAAESLAHSRIRPLWQPGDLFHNFSRVPVLTPQDMGKNWMMACRDEVYVRDRIAPQYLSGLVVHPADVDRVLKKFLPNLSALGIPVYLMDGTVLWPTA
jgi:hypothetical protein